MPVFKDKRYLKIDNKPFFHIHHPEDFDVKQFMEIGNSMAIEFGYKGIIWSAPLIYVGHSQLNLFDYLEGYPPGDLKLYNISRFPLLNRLLRKLIPNFLIKGYLFRFLNTFSFDRYSYKYKRK